MPCAFRPCPSGTTIDRGFNREHVESCSPTTKNIVTLLPQYLWPPNWAGSTYLEQLPPIKLLYSLVTWSWKITWQIKTNFISTATVSLATKLGRMLIYLEQLPSIKLLNPLVTWSYKIICETKTICGLAKSLAKLKQLYLHYHLQGWSITLKGSGHIVTWPLIRWSYLDHVTVWKIYISTFTRSLNLVGCWLQVGGLVRKHLCRLYLLQAMSFRHKH